MNINRMSVVKAAAIALVIAAFVVMLNSIGGCAPAYSGMPTRVYTSTSTQQPTTYSYWDVDTARGKAELHKVTVYPSGRVYVHRDWVKEASRAKNR